jgi:hypothetical protein
MTKYRFDSEVPELIQTELKQKLEPLEWLIPGWCQIVHIHWQEQAGLQDALITCRTDYQYRRVVLTFYPAFLSQKELQFEQLIHDLLHAFSGIAIDFADETIKLLVPENEAPKFREHLLRELGERTEAFTQDLAHCLAMKLKGG